MLKDEASGVVPAFSWRCDSCGEVWDASGPLITPRAYTLPTVSPADVTPRGSIPLS